MSAESKAIRRMNPRNCIMTCLCGPNASKSVQETPEPPAKRRYTVLDNDQVLSMQDLHRDLQGDHSLSETQIHAKLADTFNVARATVRKQLFEDAAEPTKTDRRGPGRPKLLRDVEAQVFEECRSWIKRCNLPPTMPYLRLIVN